LAEEQLPDLSTDTKRVEHFNKKVEEFRQESSDVAEAPNQAFEMARQYAQQQVFPPFGFIAFPEDSKKHTPDEMGIGIAAGRVLFGAARFIDGLKKDSPESLIQKGIDTYKGFDDSAAVNELTGATRISFATVKGGVQEIQAAIRADDKSVDDPFEDSPILSKLKLDDIENLLDSTVLKFIKELGLKRADDASDKLTLDRGEESFIKAKELAAKIDTDAPKNIEASKLNTKDDPEYMARLEKAKREDALLDSITTSKTGSKISSNDGKKLETKPEGIRATETPVNTPPVAPTAMEKAQSELVALSPNVTNTVTNNSNAISVLQDPDAKPAPVLKSETNTVTPETKVSTPVAATAITQESQPTSTNPPIEPPKSETQSMQLGDKSSVSDDETPLLKMLGESMGMSADDIAKMFAGKEDNLQKGLDLTFGGESPAAQPIASSIPGLSTEDVKATAVDQAQKITQQATTIATTTKISEPVKIAEAAPTLKQENTTEATPEPVLSTSTPPDQTNMESTGGETKETPTSETKTQGDNTNKEAGPNNDDLLKVMMEILKTLQGPLIVTESSPKFS
jgi:hypothetical protein